MKSIDYLGFITTFFLGGEGGGNSIFKKINVVLLNWQTVLADRFKNPVEQLLLPPSICLFSQLGFRSCRICMLFRMLPNYSRSKYKFVSCPREVIYIFCIFLPFSTNNAYLVNLCIFQ